MDDATFRSVRERLDLALKTADANIGVSLSPTLYREFKDRGYIQMVNFHLLARTVGINRLPAYRTTHFVSEDFDLSESEFRVGSLK